MSGDSRWHSWDDLQQLNQGRKIRVFLSAHREPLRRDRSGSGNEDSQGPLSFINIPSLRGVWYRRLLLHDGSVASLEEMFDPDRLKPDHVPGGWIGLGVSKRAIPGHPFGLHLSADEKSALIAFLRS